MLSKVAQTVTDHELLSQGTAVVAGVSGGADSVALLKCLLSLSGSIGFKVYAAHLNHGIRGESASHDQRFVAELCESWGVPLLCKTINVPEVAKQNSQTLEQAGRIVRYKFLEEARKHFNAQRIAVAHHMDDQAESVLMHLIRGSGLTGLTGMQPRRGNIIRPLLNVRRYEIEEYLEAEGIAYCTDETNLMISGTRNRLRLDVLPYIEEHFNPAIVPAICSTAQLLLRDEVYLMECAQYELNRVRRKHGYLREPLAKLPLPIKTRAIRLALEEHGALTDMERVHIEALYELLEAQTGSRMTLPGLEAWISYELIRFGEFPTIMPFEVRLNVPGETVTPLGTYIADIRPAAEADFNDKNAACMDIKLLPCDACVRTRQNGDRFFPIGAPGSKKLKEFFIDKKIPREERNLPLICTGKDVLFVPGYCIAETVRVRPHTDSIVYIKFDK